MGDVHTIAETKTWPEAFARIGRQLWNRERRQRPGCWDYRLQTLASRSRADIWRPVLARLARNQAKHRNSHNEWSRALDSLRRASLMRELKRQ